MAKITNRGVTSYSVSSVFQGGVSVVLKSVTGTVKLCCRCSFRWSVPFTIGYYFLNLIYSANGEQLLYLSCLERFYYRCVFAQMQINKDLGKLNSSR